MQNTNAGTFPAPCTALISSTQCCSRPHPCPRQPDDWHHPCVLRGPEPHADSGAPRGGLAGGWHSTHTAWPDGGHPTAARRQQVSIGGNQFKGSLYPFSTAQPQNTNVRIEGLASYSSCPPLQVSNDCAPHKLTPKPQPTGCQSACATQADHPGYPPLCSLPMPDHLPAPRLWHGPPGPHVWRRLRPGWQPWPWPALPRRGGQWLARAAARLLRWRKHPAARGRAICIPCSSGISTVTSLMFPHIMPAPCFAFLCEKLRPAAHHLEPPRRGCGPLAMSLRSASSRACVEGPGGQQCTVGNRTSLSQISSRQVADLFCQRLFVGLAPLRVGGQALEEAIQLRRGGGGGGAVIVEDALR